MDRPASPALVALLVALALGAGVASAHANHLALDPQVSAGSVVVEHLYASAPAVLVIHDPARPGGAGLGAPVGERAVPAGRLEVGAEVAVDGDAWRAWDPGEQRRLRAVLHRDDDGDGRYDPGDDPALASFGRLAGANATVRRGGAPWYVVGGGPGTRSLANRSLELERVALGAPGGVVVRAGDRVVAARPLSGGVHWDVPVGLRPDANASALDGAAVTVALYADDGDGRYGSGDRPVTAGDAPVATRVTVRTGDGVRVITPETTDGADGAASADDPALAVPGAGTGAAAGAAALVVAAALALLVRQR